MWSMRHTIGLNRGALSPNSAGVWVFCIAAYAKPRALVLLLSNAVHKLHSHRDDLVHQQPPVAAPAGHLARQPGAGDTPFPFDRQNHAAQEARRHGARAPGHHGVGPGLVPRIARREVAVRFHALDVEGAFQQAADAGAGVLMAVGDAAGGEMIWSSRNSQRLPSTIGMWVMTRDMRRLEKMLPPSCSAARRLAARAPIATPGTSRRTPAATPARRNRSPRRRSWPGRSPRRRRGGYRAGDARPAAATMMLRWCRPGRGRGSVRRASGDLRDRATQICKTIRSPCPARSRKASGILMAISFAS